MNLLAHFYLADLTQTSYAGQLLGDMVKGRLQGQFLPSIENGIYLHRRIDSFTDSHQINSELKQVFPLHIRRYASILVDIGYDYHLARYWSQFSSQSLAEFAEQAISRAQQDWPAGAPVSADSFSGLQHIIASYDEPAGIQKSLNSVARRLNHKNPVAEALPLLIETQDAFAAAFADYFPQLCDFAKAQSAQFSNF